jgi:hypothetical protein
MLRDKAIEMILENATAVDPDGNEIALDLGPTSGDIVEDEVLEGEVVMGEVVEGEVVEGEVVEGEVVPGDQVEDEFSRAEVVESTEENER